MAFQNIRPKDEDEDKKFQTPDSPFRNLRPVRREREEPREESIPEPEAPFKNIRPVRDRERKHRQPEPRQHTVQDIIDTVGRSNIEVDTGLDLEPGPGLEVETTPKSFRTQMEEFGKGIASFGEGIWGMVSDPGETASDIGTGLQESGFRNFAGSILQTTARAGDVALESGETVSEELASIFSGGREVDFNSNLTDEFVEFADLVSGTYRDQSRLAKQKRAQDQREAGEVPIGQQDIYSRLSDPEYLARDIVGSNLPSSMASYLAGGAAKLTGGSPLRAAAATGGAIEGGAFAGRTKEFLQNSDNPAMQELAESDAFVNSLSGIVGIVNGFLEGVPVGDFFGRQPISRELFGEGITEVIKRVGSGVLQQGLEEAGTESIQEIVTNIAAKTYNEKQAAFEGIPEAAAGGFLLGTGVQTGAAGVQLTQGLPVGLSIEDITDENGNLDITDEQREATREGVERRIEELEQTEVERQEETAPGEDALNPQERQELEFLRENRDNPDAVLRGMVQQNEIANLASDLQQEMANTREQMFDIVQQAQQRATEGQLPQEAMTEEETQQFDELARQMEEQFVQLEALMENQGVIESDEIQELIEQQRSPEETEQQPGDQVEETVGEGTLQQQRRLGRQDTAVDPQERAQEEGFPARERDEVNTSEAVLLKDRIRNIARGVREGRREQRAETADVQTQVIEALENSSLSNQDIAKFQRAIKNVQTESDLESALPEIERRIDRLMESQEMKDARKRVGDLLRSTKRKKQSGKPVGQLTPELQDVMDELRKLMNLKVSEAQNELLKRRGEQQGVELSPEETLQNQVLAIRARSPLMPLEDVQQFAEDLEAVINQGRTENQRSEFNRKTELQRKRNHVVDKVKPEGQQEGRASFGPDRKSSWEKFKDFMRSNIASTNFDWHGLMHLLDSRSPVGEETLEGMFGTLQQDNRYKELQSAMAHRLLEDIAEVYEVEAGTRDFFMKSRAVERKINELSNEEVNLGELTDQDGNTRELIMTRAELIKRWMEIQDPTLIESFREGNRWTNEFFAAINDNMTQQDIEIGNRLLDSFQLQYPIINDVYKEIYGVNLPSNPNYSPIQREGFQIDTEEAFGEFLEEQSYRAAIAPSSTKERTKSILPIKSQNAFDAYQRQTTEMNYFVAWGQRVREFSNVFNDPTVRQNIKDEFGSSFFKQIRNGIDTFSSNGTRFSNLESSFVNYLRKGFTVGQLAIKPQIAFKQTLSIFAYLENLSAKEFTAGIVDFMKNPIENTRTLREESTYIKTRPENIERDIRFAMQDDTFKKFQMSPSFTNLLLFNVKAGDFAPIAMGSWAIRKQMLENGASIEEAIEAYEDFGSSTQQSSDISRLSQLQNSSNPFARLFTIFKSAPNQYLRKEIKALLSLTREGGLSKENLRKVGRTIAIYHFILPITFQFFGSLQFLDGIDEEDRKDMLRAAILGSFNGWFVVGDLVDNVLRATLGQRIWGVASPLTTIFREVTQAIEAVVSDEGEFQTGEVMEGIERLTEAGTSVTGFPADQALQTYQGFKEAADGSTQRGILRIGGWSEWTLDRQLGGDTGGGGGGGGGELSPFSDDFGGGDEDQITPFGDDFGGGDEDQITPFGD